MRTPTANERGGAAATCFSQRANARRDGSIVRLHNFARPDGLLRSEGAAGSRRDDPPQTNDCETAHGSVMIGP
jgi:hypothetical protein